MDGPPDFVIDATPQIRDRPWALERLGGLPMAEVTLRCARLAGAQAATVVLPEPDGEAVEAAVRRTAAEIGLTVYVGTPSERPAQQGPTLRVNCVYDPRRLARLVHRGLSNRPARSRDASLEGAVVWRLRAPGDVQAAEVELARAIGWFPLSRFYLRPWAKWLARKLAPTRVRPNHVTLAGTSLALVAGALLWVPSEPASALAGRLIGGALPGLLLLVYWVLDMADGHLARLKGLASPAGALLDASLDEFVDVYLHACMAAALTARMRSADQPLALTYMLLCLAFFAGKYLFVYAVHTAEASRARASQEGAAGGAANSLAKLLSSPRRTIGGALTRLYRLPADADIRAHVLIVFVLLGRLDLELAWVAAYYNLRWVGKLARDQLRGRAAAATPTLASATRP